MGGKDQSSVDSESSGWCASATDGKWIWTGTRSSPQYFEKAGVHVDIFKPRGHGLTKLNRLHCKVCAIDDRTVFLGGSNIGDHYPTWDDSNLRLDGHLTNVFHQVYDFVREYTADQNQLSDPN